MEQGRQRGQLRLLKILIAALAVMLIAVAALAWAGVFDGDDLSLEVDPMILRAGEAVRVVPSDPARARGANPGLVFLQRRHGRGWETTHALSAEGRGGEAAASWRVRGELGLLFVGPPDELGSDTYRIPEVRPGVYRLTYVLWREDEEGGFGAMPERYQPKLIAEIRVVR